MAAALDIPVIVLFGPTKPECFRPFGEQHLVVIRDICPLRPCFDYCQFPEPYCMTKLTPDSITSEIENQLVALQKIPRKANY
jgi:ADP-heptose:LPS heptosyltransferase